MKKILLILFGLLVFVLSGCTLIPLLQPTPEIPAQALTILAPDEPPESENPVVEDSQPTIEPTPVSQQTHLWVAPYLPERITSGLVAPGALEMVSTREESDVRLEIAEGSHLVTNLVYVLAAPFPALEDGVSFDNLKASWLGQPKGIFQNGNLYLTQETLDIFSLWWGAPQGEFVQVLDKTELLATTWANAPAWALLPFEELEPRWKVLQVGGTSPIWKDFDFVSYPLNVPIGLSGENQQMLDELAAAFTASVPYLLNHDGGKLTTVILTGVTALVRATAVEMENKGVLHPAEDVGPLLQQADIAHISNEVPFARACPEPKPVNDRLVFCSSPDYMELLEYIGTDVVELTGDHFSDWGTEATLYTFDLYDAEGWSYYGGGRTPEEGRKPVAFEHNGNKIAFIGCNGKGGVYTPSTKGLPGAVDCDFPLIAQEIADLKDEGYVVIMTYQHHEIYSFTPTPNLIQDFKFTADAGADIVSGSQAHQPHGMEFYGDRTIMYGLGNLFFDQLLMGDNTTRAMLARHVIYNGKHISTEIFTVHFTDFSRPLFLDDAGRRRLLSQVFAASDWGELTYPINYQN